MPDTSINPVRYPTLFRYLSGLPQGLMSYPECKCISDFAINIKKKYGADLVRDDLPDSVKHVLNTEWKRGAWIPEVHFMALNALVRDVVCRSDEKYLQFCFDTMKESYSSPLMRSLMYVMSPSVLALAVENRWTKYRQGVTLKSIKSSSNGRTLQLRYPEKIYLECMLGGMGQSFGAALCCTRISSYNVDLSVVSSSEALFTVTWQV